MNVFHHRATSYILMGSFVVATMIVYGYVARTWAYKHANDSGTMGDIATGILFTSG
jgi:hypothetical protein